MKNKINQKIILSGLWGFLLFTIFFADFQSFITPGFLEEIRSGTIRGYEVTENLLLFGAVFHMIPVAMFLLSLVLQKTINKWANIAASTLYLITNLTDVPSGLGLDQILFRIFIIIGLLCIFYNALRWKALEPE